MLILSNKQIIKCVVILRDFFFFLLSFRKSGP